MDLHQFSDWLSATALSQAIQTSSWAIPGIQTVHIIALALAFTAALLLSLRIAGLGLSAVPLAEFATRYTRLIWLLLVVLLASGAALIIAEPGRTITNPVFYLKMLLLAGAIVLTLWLSAAARRAGGPAPLHVAVAVLSPVIWGGIIFAGRFIAYYEG